MELVVPALLPVSRKAFEEGLHILNGIPRVSRIQIDVVDGRFASPASWPYNAPGDLDRYREEVGVLPSLDHVQYELDLMCIDALTAIESWSSLGASHFVLHAESVSHLPRTLMSARKLYGGGLGKGLVTFGVALNIASDLTLLEPCIELMEYVQFMGIAKIGRQGQPFDRRVFEKVRVFHTRHPHIPMQVDGGISLENAKDLVAFGISHLVVGSAILGSSDPATAVASFEALRSPYGV
jgi:ribulose-phosphate 3-epimerase